MRLAYAEQGVQAAITNSGGLRADLVFSASTGGEQPGQITWGEAFAVLPFGNSTVIETLTYEQLVAALANGFRPPCGDVSGGTGRTPQYSGLWVEFHCNGTVPVIDNVWLAPPGPRPTTAPLAPGSTIRIVTNDFMFGGGDGYTALSGGSDVLQTGDLLLDVLIDAHRGELAGRPAAEGPPGGPVQLATGAHHEVDLSRVAAAATLDGMSPIPTVTDDAFAAEVLESGTPVLVDFTAAWCPPCRVMKPVLAELAAEREDVKIVQLDVDADQRTAAEYGVLSMPTFILFKDGREVQRLVGARPKRRLEAELAPWV